MSDIIDEEMQIAGEQDSSGTTLSSKAFLRPVQELSPAKVIGVDENMNLKEVIVLMQTKKIGSVVCTSGDQLTGIFTERDVLMKIVGKLPNWEKASVKDVMTPNPQSLQVGDEIAYVLNNMHVGGYRHVPIVDENEKPVSMVSIKDVVNWIFNHFPGDITNMTGEPFRGEKTREGG